MFTWSSGWITAWMARGWPRISSAGWGRRRTRKFSTLLGGRNTIEHHDELIKVCATGDAAAAAELSGQHWSELGGHINQLEGSIDGVGARITGASSR